MTGDWRLIVTGSRTWTDAALLRRELDQVAAAARYAGASRLVVVHGASYPRRDPRTRRRPARSADWLAHLWVQLLADQQPLPVVEEPHPANWSQSCRPTCAHGGRRQQRGGRSVCPAAGNYRNQLMVDRGADSAIAFWDGRSTGTCDCLDRLDAAGIPTRRVPAAPIQALIHTR